MKNKATIGVLMLALMLALAVSAQAAVEMYEVKASAYVPAFIDYKLNCAADVTVQIRPSDASGVPTGAAVKTVTFSGQARGFHRYIWLADVDGGGSASQGYYMAELSAASNQAQWEPIAGLYINTDWTHEYGGRPLPSVPDADGFYGVAVNSNPSSPYYGRIYTTHKIQKDVFMYGPDGAYLGTFADNAIAWGASAPMDVTIADDDYVYVCDRSNMVIYCFTPDGVYMSVSPTTTNHRAIMARTAADGKTYIVYSGSTNIKRISVNADHVTWQSSPFGGNTLFLNSTGNDYGVWMTQDLNDVYVAAILGADPGNGVSKWHYNGSTWAQAAGFTKQITAATDVSLVDADTDFLWITRQAAYQTDDPGTTQVEAESRALYKTDAATNAIISYLPYDIVTWGLMNSNDGVGNVAVTFGKATATWFGYYWALFAEAGTSTCSTKQTGAFFLGGSPAPVVVAASSVWTPDNAIAADDTDSASVSFKVMDVNGWADITSVTLDLRPIGYGSAVPCTLTQDLSDPAGKTAIATKTGIKAKVGTRCTTSYGQLIHRFMATPTDAAGNGYPDEDEVKLNVTGDPLFDAYIKHRRVANWYIDGAQVQAVGGGIPGATDPRAAGPFVYTSAPSDTSGYTSLEMSAGTFAVNAKKIGFGSEATVPVVVPYTGYTMDIYLRPMTIAEARAATSGTKVNVEGVCYAQPVGYNRTVEPPVQNVNGLASRTDTLTKRNQWYVCDPNTPLEGMLFMVTAPNDTFVIQWDDPLGEDMFGNSIFLGARPAEGQTIMITGLLNTPGGHERRVLIDQPDVEAAMAAVPSRIDRVYLNRGNIGGLPAPSVKALSYFYHPITTSSATSWGNFITTQNATVIHVQADGVEAGVGMTDPVAYAIVADSAGNFAQIAYDMPATTGVALPTVGTTYNFTGAASRRTRSGQGCIHVRKAADQVLVADNYDETRPTSAMASIRTLNDGDPIKVSEMVVAKIGSTLWLEAADRSVGIRVMSNPSYVAVGDTITVYGNLDIQDGEMVIVPSVPIFLPTATGGTVPGTLDMRSREVGGVGSGTTPGVTTGRGALNVGLKVHFQGMLTSTVTGGYYVWDGVNRSDAPTSDGVGVGVLIEGTVPTGCVAWQDWIDVTGVVSTKDIGGGVIAPTIIPTAASKVTTFSTITADTGTALTASWNLVGLPAVPAATSDADEWTAKPWDPYIVLGPNQSPDDVDGRMYRWENCSGGLMIWDQWSEVGAHGPFGGMVLGDGYWLDLADPWAVSYSGRNSALDQWIGICAPGWMIIGQPKDHNTYIADVIVHDGGAVYSMTDAVLTNSWIDCTGYWWDNQNQGLVDIGIPDCWASTDTLMPWHGYWIQAYQGDLALIVPEAPAAP